MVRFCVPTMVKHDQAKNQTLLQRNQEQFSIQVMFGNIWVVKII